MTLLARSLRLLPPETAHRLAISGLPFLPERGLRVPERLRTRLAGLDLPHPVGLAAGFDKNAQAFAALLGQGFGFVEIGTVTPRPQAGNPSPRLFRLPEDAALINRLGFNNEGLEAVAARLAARRAGGVVGANIGMNKDAVVPLADYRLGLERLYPLADYVTVNISSPNTPGLRDLQRAGHFRALIEPLLEARAGLGVAMKPVFVKLAPDLEEADEGPIAELALELRLDGLIVGNTTLDRPPTLGSRHRGEAGGLSGRPLFARSTRLLARFALHLGGRVPLIGVGGVSSGADAYAKIRAGATAVQLYTGLIYEGPGIVARIVAELDGFLARDGLASIGEAVGRDAQGMARGRLGTGRRRGG